MIHSRGYEKMLALDSISKGPQRSARAGRKIISRRVSWLHLYADMLDAAAYTDHAPRFFRGHLAYLKWDALEAEYTVSVPDIPGLYA